MNRTTWHDGKFIRAFIERGTEFLRRKIIITGLAASIIVFTGSIILLFVNPPHTYGRVAMILTAFTSALLIISFYFQLRNGQGKRNDK